MKVGNIAYHVTQEHEFYQFFLTQNTSLLCLGVKLTLGFYFFYRKGLELDYHLHRHGEPFV